MINFSSIKDLNHKINHTPTTSNPKYFLRDQRNSPFKLRSGQLWSMFSNQLWRPWIKPTCLTKITVKILPTDEKSPQNKDKNYESGSSRDILSEGSKNGTPVNSHQLYFHRLNFRKLKSLFLFLNMQSLPKIRVYSIH